MASEVSIRTVRVTTPSISCFGGKEIGRKTARRVANLDNC
jgi:hypothetical protein